jgi:hypothetical protein
MPTQQFGGTWSGGSSQPINQQANITQPVALSGDFAVGAASVDTQFVFECPHAKIKALLIVSTVPVVICTNAASTGSPAQSFSIDGNTFLEWLAGATVTNPTLGSVTQLQSNPITTDITSLFISCPGATAGTVSIRALLTT